MPGRLLDFLNQHANVTAEDFEVLMRLVEHRNFEKKQKLVEIGNVSNCMYYIISGLARKYFNRGKDEITTHIVKEGGIIGSAVSFLTGEPSLYSVEALEPVTAICIKRHKLEEFFRMNNKYERIGRMMFTHYFLVQENRLMDNIRYTTRERFIRFMQDNPDLILRVPQKYLATYLKIKPETFSRLKHLIVKQHHEHTN